MPNDRGSVAADARAIAEWLGLVNAAGGYIAMGEAQQLQICMEALADRIEHMENAPIFAHATALGTPEENRKTFHLIDCTQLERAC